MSARKLEIQVQPAEPIDLDAWAKTLARIVIELEQPKVVAEPPRASVGSA